MEMRRERTEDWQEWSRYHEVEMIGMDWMGWRVRSWNTITGSFTSEATEHGRYLLGTSEVSQAAAVETDPIRDRHVRSDDGRCRQRPPNPDGRIFASTIFLLFTITRQPKHHHNR